MTHTSSGTIALVTREDEDLSRGDKAELVTRQLDVADLRGRFKQFMTNLQSIIEVDPNDETPFELTEIQFSAEISANGEFKLLGTGIGVETSSAVTFVLQRKSAH